MKRLIILLFVCPSLWGDGSMWMPTEWKQETKTNKPSKP
jgi:hypothetical protein